MKWNNRPKTMTIIDKNRQICYDCFIKMQQIFTDCKTYTFPKKYKHFYEYIAKRRNRIWFQNSIGKQK